MGINTKIEWCDSTLSIEVGCQGCELWRPSQGQKTCYAGQLVERYGGQKGWPTSFDKPVIFPERLEKAMRWPDLRGTKRPSKPWLDGYPRMIFLDDLGDTFTESLPLYWLAPLLPIMSKMPVIFMLLTKRSNRMLEFSKTHPFPKNFWLMTSVTSAANYNRVEQFLQCRGGSLYGISYEPAWGPIDVVPYLDFGMCGGGHRTRDGKLGWVISGGSSGQTAKPSHPNWFSDVRDQCQQFGCAFFHKQNGEWTPENTNAPIKIRLTAEGRNGSDLANALDGGEVWMSKIGKKKAGRLLDGREWNQMPQIGNNILSLMSEPTIPLADTKEEYTA